MTPTDWLAMEMHWEIDQMLQFLEEIMRKPHYEPAADE